MEDYELDIQAKNSPADRIRPYMWKKGQSGNIMGRPKGKTMKEYAKEYLARMTDEERDEWLEGINKDTVWEMAEGKALTTSEGKIELKVPQPINYVQRHDSISEDKQPE